MDPTASWQSSNSHHPDLWLDNSCTLQLKTLDQTQEFEAAFDAWLNAVPSELRSSSNCTNSITLSVSDCLFLPTPELSPSPTAQTTLSEELAVNTTQQYSAIDVQISEIEDQRRPSKSSTPSWHAPCSQDESCQRISCSECTRTFDNLSALNKHTQSTSHKAWRCVEAGCEKTYARRDTFLRHRVAHRDDALNHVCLVCLQIKKRKVFRRKDHLRDHMRNCHSKNVKSRRVSHDSRVTFSGSDHDSMDTSVDSQVSTPVQKQAMKELVKSLGTVLGERNKYLIDDLGNKMTALSAPEMESVAQGMAGVALAKTYFSNANAKLE